MQKTSFSFIEYSIDRVFMDFTLLSQDQTLELILRPSGEYSYTSKDYILFIDFFAKKEGSSDNINEDNTDSQTVFSMGIKAKFTFRDNVRFDDIPPYFFSNSIAIIFPYIRAFVSTVTLQANTHPLIIPTLNTSPLSEGLKNNTKILD